MDANRFITEIVEPTISDFEANPASVRHAFLACVATFHSIDYLTHPKKPAGRRSQWWIALRIAFKHVQSGHDKSAHLQPLKAGDVIERPPAKWGKAVWDLSRWDDAIGGVTIKNEHGRDLLEIVKRAAEFVRASIKRDLT